jgi:hypothetical protein
MEIWTFLHDMFESLDDTSLYRTPFILINVITLSNKLPSILAFKFAFDKII